MSLSLNQLLDSRFSQWPNRLSAFVIEATETQQWLLERVLDAHVKAESIKAIQSLDLATANKNGAVNALREILKIMGNSDQLYDHRIELQTVVRRYLSACGFARANELLVSNAGAETAVLDEPELSPQSYHQIALSQHALVDELNSIYLAKAKPFNEDEVFGGVIFCLMTRDGVLSLPELRQVLVELQSGRLARLGKLFYVCGPIGKGGQQFRRLFFSPLSLAFIFRWLTLQPAQEFTVTTINVGIDALVSRLSQHADITWRKFKGLQSAAIRYLRLQDNTPQHVVDFMTGEISSTSLSESCWTRLFDFEPDPRMLVHEEEARELRRREIEKPKIVRPGFVQEICRSLAEKPQDKAKKNTLFMLAPIINRDTTQPELLVQLAEFVDWMLRVVGLESSTTKMHLENLSQVLFPMVSSLSHRIDNPDTWESMVENMLGDETRYSKAIDAVSKFSDFLTRTEGEQFASAGFSAAALVNANIITMEQKDLVVSRIRLKLQSSDPLMADVACYLVELAFGLGARRWELLGLHFSDVLGPLEAMIRFVKNLSRALKTDASTRQLTLQHLLDEPFFKDWQQFSTCQPAEDKNTNILEARGFDIKSAESKMFSVISASLKEVAGLADVSFHSLRHSAACRFMLSLHWEFVSFLEIEGSRYFDQIEKESLAIEKALLRKNTQNFLEHKTVSAFLGHLSYRTTAAHYFHFYCLLRSSYLMLTNMASLLKDESHYLVAVTEVPFDLPKDEHITVQLDFCIKEMRVPVISINTPCQQPTNLVLATDGEEIKKLLIRVSDILLLRTVAAKQTVTQELLPNQSHRTPFLSLLHRRAHYLVDLHQKVGLMKVEGRGTGKKRDHGFELFRMPVNAATQSAIGAILAEIERIYTVPEQPKATRDLRRELAKHLVDALHFYSPRDLETFSFGPKDDVSRVLTPVMSVLNRSQVQLCYWLREKKRVPGKGPRDVNGQKIYVQRLIDLPKIKKGRLMVRIEAVNQHENYKPAVLAWVMTAMYLAYGHSYLLNHSNLDS
ncbi:hypothetical protein [Paraperlucidibaca sp.]|jgi:hypothetical protein|uniref:hypothetical protein n=1 Tax=Paraperlucidibaca sp. TaxID=2708021 RepID=UPI00398A0FFA|tara:strand:+ start:3470 stop:6523 length:3054 start_codon:yes stop_codon:yes gene_type:complete